MDGYAIEAGNTNSRDFRMTIQPRSGITAPQAPGLASEVEDFSLVLGGPLYQFLARKRRPHPVEENLLWRVLLLSGICWLPLLLLCLFEGTAIGAVEIPFIRDIETHVRFLVAVPLFVIAELVVHVRTRVIVAQFFERRLIPEPALQRFRDAMQSAIRLRNAMWPELLMVIVIFPLGFYVRTQVLAVDSATWFAQVGQGQSSATLAGLWFYGVSNPVFQFLLFRWYFRLFIWARFLWQVSRIDLDLMPIHPDRKGGLGFLGASSFALAPLIAAHGAAIAGYVANRIFFTGATLPDFKLEIAGLVVLLMLVVLAPLCVFAPQIAAAKRRGMREYGNFSAEYTRRFDQRWLRNGNSEGETLLGSADIQSLADLDNAMSIVSEMRPFPIGRDALVNLIAAALIPFAPLLLTMFPLEVLLERIVGVLF